MLYKYLKDKSKYFILEPDHAFVLEALKRFAKHAPNKGIGMRFRNWLGWRHNMHERCLYVWVVWGREGWRNKDQNGCWQFMLSIHVHEVISHDLAKKTANCFQAMALAPHSLEMTLCKAFFCSVSCLFAFSALFSLASVCCRALVSLEFSM